MSTSKNTDTAVQVLTRLLEEDARLAGEAESISQQEARLTKTRGDLLDRAGLDDDASLKALIEVTTKLELVPRCQARISTARELLASKELRAAFNVAAEAALAEADERIDARRADAAKVVRPLCDSVEEAVSIASQTAKVRRVILAREDIRSAGSVAPGASVAACAREFLRQLSLFRKLD